MPEWLIAELRLQDGATATDLGRNIWNGVDSDSISPRARSYVVNLVRSRQGEILELAALDRPWPASLDPGEVPWTVRTRNCLRDSGLINNPTALKNVTFGELLDLPAMGWLSIIDFACTAEAAIENVDALITSYGSEEAAFQSSLVEAIDSVWADQVSEQDPRFADLMPTGEGTVLERLEKLTSEPHENIISQAALGEAVGRIEARTSLIGKMLLEDAVSDFLSRVSGLSGRKLDGLAVRLGWSGVPPVTLQEAGAIMGVTRERVRQIQKRVMKRMPEHPIFMPQIHRATEVLRKHSPLSITDAKALLRKNGISRSDFHPASVLCIATTCTCTTGFMVDEARESVVTDATAEVSGAIVRIARKQTGSSGVSNAQEVTAQIVKQGVEVDEELTKQYLQTMIGFEFLDDNWFWYPPGKFERNRLRNVTRKMLSVTSPITVRSLREGVRRAYKGRELSRGWSLVVPPRSVLRGFYKAHPEFVLRDGDYVESTQLLNYREVLGNNERILVDVIRISPASVLDRASLARECLKRGVNEFTFNTYLTYSPVVEHVGTNIWSLRGIELNPAAVEAVRRANALSIKERRILDHGWTEAGSLWIAWRLPELTGSFVSTVPASVRRLVANRSFDATDDKGIPSGRIKVLEDGASIGYGPFLRRRGADTDDVLVVEFSLDHDKCVLKLGDAEQFDESSFYV